MGDINLSVQPFAPALGTVASTVGLGVTASSTRVALALPPITTGSDRPRQVAVANVGANMVFVAFGDSSVVATVPAGATAGSYPVDPLNTYAGRPTIITVPGNFTHMAAIAAVAGPTQVYATAGNGG